MKRSQAEIKIELKNSETQLENSGESLLCRMDQVEDKISGLEDNRGMDHFGKKYEKLKTHTHTRKQCGRTVEHHKKTVLHILGIVETEESKLNDSDQISSICSLLETHFSFKDRSQFEVID